VTKSQVKEYIKRKLGHPAVVVELDDNQLEDAVQDALRMFNRHLMVFRNNVLRESYEYANIELPADTLGVYYVCFLMPDSLRNYTQINIFEILSRLVYPEMPMGEWYMIRMFYKMFQRVRGTDPDWRYDREANVLHVDTHGGPYDVSCITGHPVTVETLTEGSKQRYERTFLKAAVAEAKQVISPIRGKFGGIPAPGGTLTTDADKMATEAQATLEKIEGDLRKLAQARCLPVVG